MGSKIRLMLAVMFGLATILLPGESALTVFPEAIPRLWMQVLAAPTFAQTILRVEGMF